MYREIPAQVRAPALLRDDYTAPKCRVGDWIDDALLGCVEVMGWTEAPNSWPRIRRKGPAGPVLTSDLARAVRTESAKAVAYWWGVNVSQVQRWRRDLGVNRVTEGTRERLRAARAAMRPDVVARSIEAMQSPQARERAAAARRGQPASEALRAAALRGARQPKSREWSARAHRWMEAGKAAKRAGQGAGDDDANSATS